jgi:hypothetical protein
MKMTTPQVAGALKEGDVRRAPADRGTARATCSRRSKCARRRAAGASGLMIRTFIALGHVNPGFTHPEQV